MNTIYRLAISYPEKAHRIMLYVVCPESGGLSFDILFTNAQKDASSSVLAQQFPALWSSHRRQPAALQLFASGKQWLSLLNLYMYV